MTTNSTMAAQLNGYHAHVYYDAATRPAAERLAEAIGGKFPVEFGGLPGWAGRAAPDRQPADHLRRRRVRERRPWLMLNREGLDVLIHPLTDDSVDDHSKYALWLGTPVPLKLETLRRTYRPELLPTA